MTRWENNWEHKDRARYIPYHIPTGGGPHNGVPSLRQRPGFIESSGEIRSGIV